MSTNKKRVDRTGKTAYNIALTGVMMALSVVLLYIGSILPAIESTFYIFGGVATGITIVEAGKKNGLMLYLGTLILGFFIVPDKGSIVLYGFLFGLYGFVKYYIEKLDGKLAQVAAKLAFILVDSFILWTFFRELLLGEAAMPTSMMLMALGAVVVTFFIYDYIFTLGIYIYKRKFKKEHMNINLSPINKPDDDNSDLDNHKGDILEK